MHNKGSCRVCRSYFIPTSGCNACTENVSWISNKCHKIEGEKHSHNFCRIGYIKEEGNSSSTMVINSNEIDVLGESMNVAEKENQFEMEAKTLNHKKKRNIIYSFVDSYHSLCLDKKEIILAQIQACERLLK
jgi:hypothetical protein